MDNLQLKEQPVTAPASDRRKIIILIGLIIISLIVAIVVVFQRINSDNDMETIVKESSRSESQFTPLENKEETGSKLSYGNWSGEIKLGQPHGSGTLTYSTRRLVSQFDRDATVARPGEYLIGEFDCGKLLNGRLYRADGTVKEIVIVR